MSSLMNRLQEVRGKHMLASWGPKGIGRRRPAFEHNFSSCSRDTKRGHPHTYECGDMRG